MLVQGRMACRGHIMASMPAAAGGECMMHHSPFWAALDRGWDSGPAGPAGPPLDIVFPCGRPGCTNSLLNEGC